VPEPVFTSTARDGHGRALLTLELGGDEERPVIVAYGDIDLSTADLLTACGRQALAAGAKCLTLDLAAVTFFSAAGLHALMALRRSAQHPTQVVLRDPSPSVRRVLQLSGLSDALTAQHERPSG
jgi:anti-anti-sigma factor